MRLSVPRLGKADRCGASSPKVNGCTQDVPAAIVISTFQKSPSYNSYKKLRAQNRTYDCVRFRAYLVDFSYGLLPLCFRHGDGESRSALPRRIDAAHRVLREKTGSGSF